MTDREALLAAILATPEDDTPRLAYADWCDERAAENPTKPCPGCEQILQTDRGGCWPCRACGAREWSGRGTVPDTSLADRAEFIRVQCELARTPEFTETTGPAPDISSTAWTTYKSPCPHHARLRRRERELLEAGWPEWSSPVLCRWHCDDLWAAKPTPAPHIAFRRGFVHALTCTSQDWLAHADRLVWPPTVACPECGGRRYGRRVARGGTSSVLRQVACPHCSGTGRVRNDAPPAETCQPIVEVTLSDKEPCVAARSYLWFRAHPSGTPVIALGHADLPPALFDALPGRDTGIAVFDTRSDALKALSAACLAFGRDGAGDGVGSPGEYLSYP